MTHFRFTFLACLLLAGLQLKAQDFTLSGEFKPRFEYRNGYGKLRPANDSLDKAATFITQRSRVIAAYNNPNQRLKLGLTLQDVRNWGSTEQQNIGDKNTLDLHEFWVELGLGKQTSIKAGRQELNYDNARVIGNSDWGQQARSFDAALFKYDNVKSQFKFQAGFGLNSKSETLTEEVYDVANYKYLQLLWANKKFKNLGLSFLFLNNGMEYTVNKALPVTAANRNVAYSQTVGSRLELVKNAFAFNAEGYYQGGRDANNQKLSAWNLGADASLKASPNFTFVLGTEFISGTDMDETDNKNHSFSPLYGTNHKFNGLMDYFIVGGRLNKIGLQDYYFSLRYKKDRFNAELTPHAFYSMGKLVSGGNEMDKFLGIETDLTAGYRISEIAVIQAGFSVMNGSKSLENLTTPAADRTKFNCWVWSQLILKPKFFSTGK